MCIKEAVLNVQPVVVGGGTDGVSVNIAQHSIIKEEIQKALPWMFWSWCYAHRLQLACKNGLVGGLFKSIEEMLLRVYYLYDKSPKKARELVSIVNELKEVFEFPHGGTIPVRSQDPQVKTTSESMILQGSDLDIVFAMKQILKTSDTLKSLMQLDPLQWPTVKLLDRLKDEGHENTYQGAVLKNYSFAAVEFYKKEALADLKRVLVNMRHVLSGHMLNC